MVFATRVRSALRFIGHQFNSTIGVGFLAGFVGITVSGFLRLIGVPLRTNSQIVTGTPYYPVQIILALLLGLSLGVVLAHRSMFWVWILPLLNLSYVVATNAAVLDIIPTYGPKVDQTRWSHYFGWGCKPDNPCPDQLTTTMLFYAAVFYSLGALLARKVVATASVKVKFWAVFSVGLILFAPLAETIFSVGYLAFTRFDLLSQTLSNFWREVSIAWWSTPLVGVSIAFPLAMGGFLVRSAFILRKQDGS